MVIDSYIIIIPYLFHIVHLFTMPELLRKESAENIYIFIHIFAKYMYLSYL
jgi:hypothetical protein